MRFTNSDAIDIRQVAPRMATPLSAHRNDYVKIFGRPVGGTGVGILHGV